MKLLIVPVFLLGVVGLVTLFNPRGVWSSIFAPLFKNPDAVEPSDLGYGFMRLWGYIVAMICFFWIAASLN